MKSVQLAVTILCLAGWTGAAQAQESVNIAYKPFKPGEVLRTHTSTDTVGTVSGLGPGGQNMTQKADQWMKMECLDTDAAGVTTIRITFERMGMTMNVGPIRMAYDSADKDAASSPTSINPIARMFDAMIGKSMTARVDPQGKALEVTGYRDIMNGVFEKAPGGQQMAKMMESILSDDTIMEKFGYFTWLPKKPVQVGETWPSQQEMQMGPLGKIVMKGKNKLIGIETVNGHRCARVATTMNMEMDNADKPYEIDGKRLQMQMTSTGGTGSWLWDLDRGRMLQMKTTTPMEMTLRTRAPASQSQPADGLKMVQKLTYTTVMEEVEGNPNKMPPESSAAEPADGALMAGQGSPPAASASQPAGNKP